MSKRVIVVGAGAAGLSAAVFCARKGARVTLFEKEKSSGKKLLITGKGRCNLTNDCDIYEALKNIPRNPRFMFSALNAFSPRDIMSFFEALGVRLKVERGKRVFPESDKSSDVLEALESAAQSANVMTVRSRVTDIIVKDGRAVGVRCSGKEYSADAVVVATGGKSYPKTGSTGDGYRLADRLGISTTETSPSLVPIVTDNKDKSELMGLSLRNVKLKMYDKEKSKPVYEDLGEMLFTHFGVSGPLVLTSSAYMKPECEYFYEIDLKPALYEEKLDRRILRDFSENPNRAVLNTLKELLPKTLIPSVLRKCGISASLPVNSVTKEQRKALISVLKAYRLDVVSCRPIEEAIVTRGGISVSELNPKTMECKRCKGLYFIGEVIDVDGLTGGFNLTIAFSTAHAAAAAIADA